MTSTTMSTLEDKTSSKFSVHCTVDGSQSTFLRATLRLQMWVRRKGEGSRSHRILATERPTVPKPTIATFHSFESGATVPVLSAASSLEIPVIPSPVCVSIGLTSPSSNLYNKGFSPFIPRNRRVKRGSFGNDQKGRGWP